MTSGGLLIGVLGRCSICCFACRRLVACIACVVPAMRRSREDAIVAVESHYDCRAIAIPGRCLGPLIASPIPAPHRAATFGGATESRRFSVRRSPSSSWKGVPELDRSSKTLGSFQAFMGNDSTATARYLPDGNPRIS